MLDHLTDAVQSDAVCAIEWPGAVPAEFRAGATTITLEALDETTRQISVESPYGRLLASAREAAGSG
jgi:tRNA A37 threonylcarbamoyladenosine biosynthesis protein TsaE